MRWLLVSRQHSPAHGGVGAYVQRFLRAAHEADWHVEIVTQPLRDELCLPCARVHEVETIDMLPGFESRLAWLRQRHVVRPYRYALWSRAVAERLLTIDGGFDAIEIVDCQAEGFAALGCAAIRDRFARAALIVHAHTPMFVEETINGANPTAFGRGLYHHWERRGLALADGVVVTARVLADALASIATSAIIPYPIDEGRALVSGHRTQRIVLVGSVQPRKGVDIWAKSLNEVLQARPDVRATLIGPDTATGPGDSSMIECVRQMIDPPLRDRFEHLGALPHEQTLEIIEGSALVVVPSRLESFSFAAAEALLAGTPTLVSDRVGLAEHVPSLPRVPVEDAHALAEAQIEMLADPMRSRQKALTCRNEMLQSCEPGRVLAMRGRFVSDLQRNCRVAQRTANSSDTLAEMAAFIASVESEEAVAASDPLVSSDVS